MVPDPQFIPHKDQISKIIWGLTQHSSLNISPCFFVAHIRGQAEDQIYFLCMYMIFFKKKTKKLEAQVTIYLLKQARALVKYSKLGKLGPLKIKPVNILSGLPTFLNKLAIEGLSSICPIRAYDVCDIETKQKILPQAFSYFSEAAKNLILKL